MKKNLLFAIETFCAIVVCFGIFAYQTYTKPTGLMRLNIEALAGIKSEDCSDGTPHSNCKIWNVYLESDGRWWCSTGGDWKCSDPNI